MRRLGLNIIVTAAFLLSSCSGEAVFPEQEVSLTPSELAPLTISTGEMTRTSLSGTVVNWSDDDQIAVFDDLHTNNKFEAVEVSGSVAVFEGLVKARTTDIYAVYPYSDAVKADAQSILVCLPSDQTPVSGTFAEEHNISVAHGQKTAEADVVDGLMFRNVCALIQFTVPQRLAEVTEVSFTANNRNLAGDLVLTKADFGVACTSGVQTVKMVGDFSAGSTFYFVVAPGEISGFSAKVKTRNGATYTKSSTKAFIAKAGAIKNLGEIDFTITSSVVARHYNDENGNLKGTDVTLHLGFPDDLLLDYVQELDAVMYDSDGREYRHLTLDSPSTSELMDVSTGRTYIPQGVYNVDCVYTINGKKTSMTLDVAVPAPDFKVTAYAYTSYDKYLERDLHAANYICDPMKVYDIRFAVGINDDIIKQYGVESCSPQISISGNRRIIPGNYDPMSRECFSCSEYLVDRWGTYQIVGSVTFDGVTKNISPKNIYITGLPYSVSFYGRNSAPSGWTVGGTISWTGYGWNSGDTDDYLRLRGNNDYANRGYAMSPMFETPSTLNVQTELDCFYYSSTVNQKSTIYVNANSASHPATTTNATTIQTRAKFNDFDHIENVRNNTTLTSSKPCITITHDVRSSSIETQFFGLKFLTVLYR